MNNKPGFKREPVSKLQCEVKSNEQIILPLPAFEVGRRLQWEVKSSHLMDLQGEPVATPHPFPILLAPSSKSAQPAPSAPRKYPFRVTGLKLLCK